MTLIGAANFAQFLIQNTKKVRNFHSVRKQHQMFESID